MFMFLDYPSITANLCTWLHVIFEDIKQGEGQSNLKIPEPKVEVQHIMHSLQMNKVLDIFRRDDWPVDVSTHPGKSQRLVSAELPSKLQTNTSTQIIRRFTQHALPEYIKLNWHYTVNETPKERLFWEAIPQWYIIKQADHSKQRKTSLHRVELYNTNYGHGHVSLHRLPWGRTCKERAVSCWWVLYRRRSESAGSVECAGSCLPGTWSRQCCRQSKGHLLVKGSQIYPVTEIKCKRFGHKVMQ